MFNNNDEVLVTCQVLRKNPTTGVPETLNLSGEEGVVKKSSTFEDQPAKNTYHVETQYGVHFVNESKLAPKPPAE